MVHSPTTAATHAKIDGMLLVGDIFDVGIVAVSDDLRVVRWNSWMQAASKVAAGEASGRSLLDLFPAIAGTPREALLRRAIGGDVLVLSHRLHEYLLPLPAPGTVEDFELMQQSVRIVPLTEEEHGMCGAVAFIQDVTERVAREAELQRARDAAEASSRAKSEFLAAMSHELRTPLNAVIGYAGLLTHGVAGTLSAPQLQHVERITASAWHLIGVIDQVLTFSRAEAGREELAVEAVDLVATARMAITFVEPQAMGKNLSLTLRSDEDVMMIQSDPLRVQQILVNLLGNAVKFTDQGSINVSVKRDTDVVVVAVRDTGPGIPPAYRESIFEAFTQVDQTATRKKGGTGLGLPVSLKLAHLLGGALTLEEAEAGSTFVLRLPASGAQHS